LWQNILVSIRRVSLSILHLANAIGNLNFPNIVQVKGTNAIVCIDNIQQVAVPHYTTSMDSDRLEIIIGRRIHEKNMAILVRLAIDETHTYTVTLLIPTDNPRFVVIPFSSA
jgi:hypothetical protein